MKCLSKLLLIACLGSSGLAFAQDGCYYKNENAYLNIGAMRGSSICSKLPNGQYIWVEANAFDASGGCWFVDKYPVGSIIDNYGLKQCVEQGKNSEWVPYKSA